MSGYPEMDIVQRSQMIFDSEMAFEEILPENFKMVTGFFDPIEKTSLFVGLGLVEDSLDLVWARVQEEKSTLQIRNMSISSQSNKFQCSDILYLPQKQRVFSPCPHFYDSHYELLQSSQENFTITRADKGFSDSGNQQMLRIRYNEMLFPEVLWVFNQDGSEIQAWQMDSDFKMAQNSSLFLNGDDLNETSLEIGDLAFTQKGSFLIWDKSKNRIVEITLNQENQKESPAKGKTSSKVAHVSCKVNCFSDFSIQISGMSIWEETLFVFDGDSQIGFEFDVSIDSEVILSVYPQFQRVQSLKSSQKEKIETKEQLSDKTIEYFRVSGEHTTTPNQNDDSQRETEEEAVLGLSLQKTLITERLVVIQHSQGIVAVSRGDSISIYAQRTMPKQSEVFCYFSESRIAWLGKDFLKIEKINSEAYVSIRGSIYENQMSFPESYANQTLSVAVFNSHFWTPQIFLFNFVVFPPETSLAFLDFFPWAPLFSVTESKDTLLVLPSGVENGNSIQYQLSADIDESLYDVEISGIDSIELDSEFFKGSLTNSFSQPLVFGYQQGSGTLKSLVILEEANLVRVGVCNDYIAVNESFSCPLQFHLGKTESSLINGFTTNTTTKDEISFVLVFKNSSMSWFEIKKNSLRFSEQKNFTEDIRACAPVYSLNLMCCGSKEPFEVIVLDLTSGDYLYSLNEMSLGLESFQPEEILTVADSSRVLVRTLNNSLVLLEISRSNRFAKTLAIRHLVANVEYQMGYFSRSVVIMSDSFAFELEILQEGTMTKSVIFGIPKACQPFFALAPSGLTKFFYVATSQGILAFEINKSLLANRKAIIPPFWGMGDGTRLLIAGARFSHTNSPADIVIAYEPISNKFFGVVVYSEVLIHLHLNEDLLRNSSKFEKNPVNFSLSVSSYYSSKHYDFAIQFIQSTSKLVAKPDQIDYLDWERAFKSDVKTVNLSSKSDYLFGGVVFNYSLSVTNETELKKGFLNISQFISPSDDILLFKDDSWFITQIFDSKINQNDKFLLSREHFSILRGKEAVFSLNFSLETGNSLFCEKMTVGQKETIVAVFCQVAGFPSEIFLYILKRNQVAFEIDSLMQLELPEDSRVSQIEFIEDFLCLLVDGRVLRVYKVSQGPFRFMGEYSSQMEQSMIVNFVSFVVSYSNSTAEIAFALTFSSGKTDLLFFFSKEKYGVFSESSSSLLDQNLFQSLLPSGSKLSSMRCWPQIILGDSSIVSDRIFDCLFFIQSQSLVYSEIKMSFHQNKVSFNVQKNSMLYNAYGPYQLTGSPVFGKEYFAVQASYSKTTVILLYFQPSQGNPQVVSGFEVPPTLFNYSMAFLESSDGLFLTIGTLENEKTRLQAWKINGETLIQFNFPNEIKSREINLTAINSLEQTTLVITRYSSTVPLILLGVFLVLVLILCCAEAVLCDPIFRRVFDRRPKPFIIQTVP